MTIARAIAAGDDPAGRHRLAVVLLAAMLSFVVVSRAPLLIWAIDGLADASRAMADWTYYNVTYLSVSYGDAGFVRRGLGGTIARLLSADPLVGALLLHILSALLLVAAFAVVQSRYLRRMAWQPAAFMVLFAALSPQLFVGWANDVGRTDMLVIATIAWAVIAIESGRPMVSGILLVIGFLVHETAIIFGAPLLLAAAALAVRDGSTDLRSVAKAALLFVLALAIIIVVQTFTTPSAAQFGASMLRNTPPPTDAWHEDLRDCAIYMMIAGMRGLRTAICYNFYWPAFGLMVIVSLAVTVVNGVILGLERHPWWFALVALLPMLFMNAVANDSGRWVKFACANAWLLAALYARRGEIAWGAGRLAANAVLLAGMIYMGTSPVHEINRASLSIARRLGLPAAPEVRNWMTHCDPAWRDVAHGRVAP